MEKTYVTYSFPVADALANQHNCSNILEFALKNLPENTWCQINDCYHTDSLAAETHPHHVLLDVTIFVELAELYSEDFKGYRKEISESVVAALLSTSVTIYHQNKNCYLIELWDFDSWMIGD